MDRNIGNLLHLSICFLLLAFGKVCAQELKPVYEDSTYKHDPYDLTKMSKIDSTDVYFSHVNYWLRLPQYAWAALSHPLGQFTIYAEHTRLWVRYFDLFTNKDGTFGVFPVLQIGGETDHGGGGRFFHTNLFGKRKIITGQYVYSGHKGQFGEGLYVHPNFLGRGVVWTVAGGYLQTRHREANINTALDDHTFLRLFEIKQVDVNTGLDWQQHHGPMARFIPQWRLSGWVGYARRDFQPYLGGKQPLTDMGSSQQARLLKGLGSDYSFYRVGGQLTFDSRDYREPTQTLSHPMNYRFPGRIVKEFDGEYYFYRDVGYPERGALFSVESEFALGTDNFKFYRVGAEASKYITLFWKDRVLAVRARLDKVTPLDGGAVPYTELVQMGGNEAMRGYERGFFRGQGALQLNVEYRYPIWDTWNAFLFWDEGQNFDHYVDLTWDDFHSSWGGGIAFRTEVGLIGKIKVGHSAVEKVLVGFTFKQAF